MNTNKHIYQIDSTLVVNSFFAKHIKLFYNLLWILFKEKTTIKLFLGNSHVVFPLHYSKTQSCHNNIKTQQQQQQNRKKCISKENYTKGYMDFYITACVKV